MGAADFTNFHEKAPNSVAHGEPFFVKVTLNRLLSTMRRSQIAYALLGIVILTALLWKPYWRTVETYGTFIPVVAWLKTGT